MGRTIRLRGIITRLEPYPFGIGKAESFLMRLEDDGASIELIYDRWSVSYRPNVGDRVLVLGEIEDYRGYPPRQFIAGDVKAID